jgi:hypothetical protein
MPNEILHGALQIIAKKVKFIFFEIFTWLKNLTLKQWFFLALGIFLLIMMSQNDQPGYDEWGGEHIPHKSNRPQPSFQDE